MRARCLLCGRFFSDPTPDPTVCVGHIYDWNRLSESERSYLIHQAVYRIVHGAES